MFGLICLDIGGDGVAIGIGKEHERELVAYRWVAFWNCRFWVGTEVVEGKNAGRLEYNKLARALELRGMRRVQEG